MVLLVSSRDYRWRSIAPVLSPRKAYGARDAHVEVTQHHTASSRLNAIYAQRSQERRQNDSRRLRTTRKRLRTTQRPQTHTGSARYIARSSSRVIAQQMMSHDSHQRASLSSHHASPHRAISPRHLSTPAPTPDSRFFAGILWRWNEGADFRWKTLLRKGSAHATDPDAGVERRRAGRPQRRW